MVCILLYQLLQIKIKTLILQIRFIAIDLNIHIYSFIKKLILLNHNNQFLIDDIKFLINKYLIIINIWSQMKKKNL